MKYAIYGAGSLGIVFSAFLAKNGEIFDVIDRNPKSVDALNKNGAIVTGKLNFSEKVNAILDTDVKENYDIVFLFTKQIDNEKIVNNILKFLKKDGVICTMQNGLPEIGIANIIGSNRTYGAAVGWGATRTDYGISELTSEPKREFLTFSLGNLEAYKDSKFEEIVRILNIMGNVEIENNFLGARWVKLLINSAFSGMSAVCGKTFGDVAKNKHSRRIIQRIIKECIDVANKAGIKIEKIQGKDVVKLLNYKSKFKKWLSFLIIPIAIKKHNNIKSSMLQDIEKGIVCEINAINGVVSEFGRKYNISTPYNDMVIEIIKRIEKNELYPSFENLQFFDKIKEI